jgi:hypothetical protein
MAVAANHGHRFYGFQFEGSIAAQKGGADKVAAPKFVR